MAATSRSPAQAGRGAPTRTGASRLRVGLAAVVLLAVACDGPRRAGPDAERALLAGSSLILINIDALRADHLGTYGYTRETSPFLDEVAREGVVFENAISHSSYTRESVAALLTGRLPSGSGSVGWFAAPGPEAHHLGRILRAAGYRSGFLSNTLQLKLPGFSEGFDEVQHLPLRWDVSGAGGKLSARALAFVEACGGRPFFLYLHYLDPHAPYRPARDLHLRFAERAFPAPLSLYPEILPRLPELVASGFAPGDARFDDLVLRYDAEIAATDEAVAALFRGLEKLGRLDETLVVITADHGEEFLDHGFLEHGWTLYQESIHVPLIFWAPRVLRPQRVPVRVSQVDVAPTVLDLLGIEPPDATWDGVPLFAREGSDGALRAARRPHFAELLLRKRNVVRAVILDEWKYLAAQRWVAPHARQAAEEASVDLAGPPVREELYHLAEDPDETRDRRGDAPEKLEEMRAVLRAYLDERRDSLASAAGARGRPPAVSPEEAERLRALGYH